VFSVRYELGPKKKLRNRHDRYLAVSEISITIDCMFVKMRKIIAFVL
jgi:hypothetical protein